MKRVPMGDEAIAMKRSVRSVLKKMLCPSVEIIKNLYEYKHVIRQAIITEIKGRFAGSFGGLLWHVIQPLLMLMIYLFVFIYVFRLRVDPSGTTARSALYLMSGLFPWMIMAEGLSRGTVVIIENANLIKRTFFPIEILLAKSVLIPFCSFGIALGVIALIRIVFRAYWTIPMFLPWIVALQLLFTFAVLCFTATIAVFFRDIVQLMNIFIQFWIFLTPILYPVNRLPQWAQRVMYFNPLYPLISMYQTLFLNGTVRQWHMLLVFLLWTTALGISGAYLFTKLKDEFADWL